MTTTLYLARHGQTIWNSEKRMQGWEDSPLSPRGVLEAQSLQKRIKGIPFDAIYASDIGRAMHTAEIVLGERNQSIQPCPGLREMHFGVLEGLCFTSAETDYPEAFKNLWETPHLYRPIAEGETLQEVQTRVVKAIQRIVADHLNQQLLIISHTIALRSLLLHFTQGSLADLWQPPHMKPASLSIAEVTGETVHIRLNSDASHLPD